MSIEVTQSFLTRTTCFPESYFRTTIMFSELCSRMESLKFVPAGTSPKIDPRGVTDV